MTMHRHRAGIFYNHGSHGGIFFFGLAVGTVYVALYYIELARRFLQSPLWQLCEPDRTTKLEILRRLPGSWCVVSPRADPIWEIA